MQLSLAVLSFGGARSARQNSKIASPGSPFLRLFLLRFRWAVRLWLNWIFPFWASAERAPRAGCQKWALVAAHY